jgi:hypothetical protein
VLSGDQSRIVATLLNYAVTVKTAVLYSVTPCSLVDTDFSEDRRNIYTRLHVTSHKTVIFVKLLFIF